MRNIIFPLFIIHICLYFFMLSCSEDEVEFIVNYNAEYTVSVEGLSASGAISYDFDVDGDLDVFIFCKEQDFFLINQFSEGSDLDSSEWFIVETGMINPETVSDTRAAELFDYNNDEYMDIICVCDGENYILLNENGASFAVVKGIFGENNNNNSYGLAVANLDADDLPDIFVGNTESCPEIYINEGNGNFSFPAESAIIPYSEICEYDIIGVLAGDFYSPASEISNDLNAADIILIPDGDKNPLLLYNQIGSGIFNFADVISPCAKPDFNDYYVSGAISDDFNNDGLSDIFFYSYWQNPGLFYTEYTEMYETGDGSCKYVSESDSEIDDPVQMNKLINYNDLLPDEDISYTYNAYSFDINNDGYNDIFCANGGKSNFLLNSGGFFEDYTDEVLPDERYSTNFILPGDFNLDGSNDLIFITDGKIIIMVN